MDKIHISKNDLLSSHGVFKGIYLNKKAGLHIRYLFYGLPLNHPLFTKPKNQRLLLN